MTIFTMYKDRKYALIRSCTLYTCAVFAVVWLYVFNRYFVLYYHEQTQLFRIDSFYFHSFLDVPGGIAAFIGTLFTHFYYYHIIGALFVVGVASYLFSLFYRIYTYDDSGGRLFLLPFIPAFLLMVSFVDIYFGMAEAVGLLVFLIGFRLYVGNLYKVRYILGFLLIGVVYFIAGGNALLLTVMLFIYELTVITDQPLKTRYKWLYLSLLIIVSALLPLFAYQWVYTISLHKAYFALTPLDFLYPTTANKALWLSFPVIYLCWNVLLRKISLGKFNYWKVGLFNGVLALLMTACGAYLTYDRRASMISQMTYDVQHDNWKSVLAVGKAYPGNNPLACYLVNIALAESGQMPYHMFQYRQIGTSGLFLDRHLSYTMMWHLGEVYYRLGLIPEAEHCAFEALVSYPREPNAQTLRRLVTTNIIRRDSATAAKYIHYFDKSPFYIRWAQQQWVYLDKAMADPDFLIPNTPKPALTGDFFINYREPDRTLFMLLQSNPTHRLAFEYLISYWLLQKNIEQVKLCMDRFYGNMNYPAIPTHYEEALLIYMATNRLDSEFYKQYPISRATRDRFGQFVQAYNAYQTGKGNLELLKKQFGHTYWYYAYFNDTPTSQKTDEENRY